MKELLSYAKPSESAAMLGVGEEQREERIPEQLKNFGPVNFPVMARGGSVRLGRGLHPTH